MQYVSLDQPIDIKGKRRKKRELVKLARSLLKSKTLLKTIVDYGLLNRTVNSRLNGMVIENG
jgi:hypothetical protein